MDLPGYSVNMPRARGEQIKQVAAAIKLAKRPVIYCGGGVVAWGASQEMREFLAKTQIPATMTVMGLGAIPADEPLCLDMLGMHGSVYSNFAVRDCDLLIALGVRFDDRVTGNVREFAKHAKIAKGSGPKLSILYKATEKPAIHGTLSETRQREFCQGLHSVMSPIAPGGAL